MANTFDLIGQFTVTSSTFSVTITNIPQTYSHLIIYGCYRSTGSAEVVVNYVSPNSNTTTANYDGRWLRWYGTGSDAGFGPGSRPGITGYAVAANNTANLFSAERTVIPMYSQASYNKSAQSTFTQVGYNQASAYSVLVSTNIKYTNALTSLYWQPNGNNIAANSTFYIYGLKNS